MCDNAKAIEQIAADIKIVKADLSRIEKHLDKQNGRIGAVENKIVTIGQDVAIQKNRCALLSQFEEKNFAHLQGHVEDNTSKVIEFAKKNGVQVAEIVAIVGMFGKISGWW